MPRARAQVGVKWDPAVAFAPRGLPVTHMSSFQEPKWEKVAKRRADDALLYHAAHLSRVYPARLRVDSSNFNPFLAWSGGAQMAALNVQTPGTPLQLNKAMFRGKACARVAACRNSIACADTRVFGAL